LKPDPGRTAHEESTKDAACGAVTIAALAAMRRKEP